MPVPIFDINVFVENYIPPNYRLPKWLAALRSFLFGLDWNMQIFLLFKNGADMLPYYASGTTYAYGDRIVYKYKVYESLSAGNAGNTPDTNKDSWLKILNNFIGMDEMVKMTGNYLQLTWYLNRQFKYELDANSFIGFRQPPYPAPYDYGLGGGTFSDIYITNITPVHVSLAVGDTSQIKGVIRSTSTAYGVTDVTVDADASSYGFEIHIPSTVYAAIDATPAIADTIIDNFLSNKIAIGTFYNIVTY